MSDSNTGETSRFKVRHIEGATNSGANSQDASNSHNDDNQTSFTAAVQKSDKHKKRKDKRKRETSPESSSLDSKKSSSSEDSVEECNSTKSHRFQIIAKSESHKRELPGEMADYFNHQFECFTAENYEEENLLILQSVPENVRGVKNWTIL